MFDARKLERICGAFIRWVFIAALCPVGLFLLLMSLVALVGIGEPGPRPSLLVSIPVSLLFLAAGIGWFAGIVWLVFYLRRRRRQHDRVA